ncbi:unannotated protein [freshwater metagenome]|uniref:Unannotated protein n=1 Tax=freshwater metagenome TaxID=449393 RepID=A0A6J7GMG8_9ZZZZ
MRSPASDVKTPINRSRACAVVPLTWPSSTSKSSAVRPMPRRPCSTIPRHQYIDPAAKTRSSSTSPWPSRRASSRALRWLSPQNSGPSTDPSEVTTPRPGSSRKADMIVCTLSRSPSSCCRKPARQAAPSPDSSACDSLQALFFVWILSTRWYGSRIPLFTAATVGQMSRPWFSTRRTRTWRAPATSPTTRSSPDELVMKRSKGTGMSCTCSSSSGSSSGKWAWTRTATRAGSSITSWPWLRQCAGYRTGRPAPARSTQVENAAPGLNGRP